MTVAAGGHGKGEPYEQPTYEVVDLKAGRLSEQSCREYAELSDVKPDSQALYMNCVPKAVDTGDQHEMLQHPAERSEPHDSHVYAEAQLKY